MFRRLLAILAAFLISSGTGSADSSFVVQFVGAVPQEIRAIVNVERVDDGRCARSCVVTTNVRTFRRDETGIAYLGLRLPPQATRVCLHELSANVVFDRAILYLDRTTTFAVSRGEDFDNYVAPESWGGYPAPDGHTYFACSPIGADAAQAYGLVIVLR